MQKITYDLEILSADGEISAAESAAKMRSVACYSLFLNTFIKKSPKFLQYSPDVVAFSPDAKEDFLKDLAILRLEFDALGIKMAKGCFDDLEEAANNSKAKALSDKLVHFKAIVEMVSRNAQAAQIITEARPVIMAVDDMPEMLSILKEILSENYDVLPITNVPDALDALSAHLPDLFLLDIEMPDKTGFDMAETLCEDFALREVPVLFLTAKHDKDIVVEAKRLGGKGYILKPVDKHALISRIEYCLKGAVQQ